MEILRAGAGVALLWAAAGLLVAWRGAGAFGIRAYRAKPAGDAGRGILYALGAGMLPGAKESVRTHLGSWFLGVGYHLGLFAGLLLFAFALAGRDLASPPAILAAAITPLGALCGAALLLKRAASPHLRSFSTPDDYLSNLLATTFAACAGMAVSGTIPVAWFLVSSAALLFYLPLGKIRHCLFFFPTRIHFGSFFGRRGVLPPARGARG